MMSKVSMKDKKPAPKAARPPRNMSKAVMRRYFGNSEFHYIKTCTHDTKRVGLCSFCKIIEKEAQTYLRDERAGKELQRLHGFYRRAEMRFGLVREWSKNQLLANKNSLQYHSAEIVLCSRVADCIGHFEDINSALDNITLTLRKRIRVLEVGEFAAIYIQAIVRGHITRKRIRHYMLKRFQFNAANARRKAYFMDQEKGSRWKTAPFLIKNERPVSPTTMTRRLRSETKKCEGHMIKYENACKRDESYLHQKRGGLWNVLEEDATMLRQMILLRDVIHSVLSILNAKRREAGERPTNKKSILPSGGPKGPHPSEVPPPATSRRNDDSDPDKKIAIEDGGEGEEGEGEVKQVVKKKTNRYRRGMSTGDGLTASAAIPEGENGAMKDQQKKTGHDYSKQLTGIQPSLSAFPYWFSFSNPAPPVRQIYLSLALKTPALPTEVTVELSPAELEAKRKAEEASKVVITAEALASKGVDSKGKKGKDGTGKESGVSEPVKEDIITDEEMELLEKKKNPNVLTLNERFMFLDKRIWSQMVCFDAEDMLRKISLADDVHPAVCSGAGIAEDEHRVWCGDVSPGGEVPGIRVRGLKVPNDDSDDESTIQYSATDSEDEADSNSASGSRQGVVTKHPETEVADDLTEGSIIPIQLQIHPLLMHREPSKMFRLFFVRGVLRAVCHASPWTYYSDVWTNKASVVKATANYSRLAVCTELINSITMTARDKTKGKNAPPPILLNKMPSLTRMNSLGRAPSLSRMDSFASTSNLTDKPPKGSCISVRVPDEKVIFDGVPEMKSVPLTSQEYKRIGQSYGFLRKMHAWKKYKRKTKHHVAYESNQAESTLSVAELQQQENIAAQLAGGPNMERKIAVMPPPDELMGSTIYKLCCSGVPQCTLSDAARQRLVNYSGSNGYRSLLKKSTNSGETLMEHCLALPEANEQSKDLNSEIPPHPDFDLIVLDVYLKEPVIEVEDVTNEPPDMSPLGSKGGALRRQSSLLKEGNKLPALKDKKTAKGTKRTNGKVPLIDYSVELHQVVGTFSTSSERPPASIDTGMFEWSDIKAFGVLPPKVEEVIHEPPPADMSPFQISQLDKIRSTAPEWESHKKSQGSGVFTYVASMTTCRTQHAAPDDKHLIEFRVLGRRPTREYLQAIVPLKIRKWVGMKY